MPAAELRPKAPRHPTGHGERIQVNPRQLACSRARIGSDRCCCCRRLAVDHDGGDGEHWLGFLEPVPAGGAGTLRWITVPRNFEGDGELPCGRAQSATTVPRLGEGVAFLRS